MIFKLINNMYRKQIFSKYENIYLLCLTLAGAIVRIVYHYNRPFTGDEVGTLVYMKTNVAFILTHFESWLTMNYFILLEKIVFRLAGYNQVVLNLIPLLAGISTIPLSAMVAKQFTRTRTALIVASLVAINGYLIYFSGVIRAYSLLTAMSLIVILLFFKWFSERTYKNGIYVAVSCFILMLTHLNGIYILAYILGIAGIEALDTWRKQEKIKIKTLIIPLIVTVLLMIISYIKIIPQFLIWGIPWHDTSPTSIAYIPYTFSEFFGSGYYGWLSMILLTSGILITLKDEKPLLILLPFIILPIVLISIQGISHFPWAYSRFLIFTLPVCIIFIAEGIYYIPELFPSINSNRFSLVITAIVFITWIPNIYIGFDSQSGIRTKFDYPWKTVASFILNSSRVNGIFYSNDIERINLTPYLSESPYPQTDLYAFEAKTFTPVDGENVFFITTGPSIVSSYPRYTFGKIQVILYPAVDYRNQLEMIKSDLLRSENIGKVTPELADVYLNIWALSKKLNQENTNDFIYYDLYIHSSELTERQRNAPLSLQYWELEQAGYRILKN